MNTIIKYTKKLFIPLLIISIALSYIFGILTFIWPALVYFFIVVFFFIKLTDWD